MCQNSLFLFSLVSQEDWENLCGKYLCSTQGWELWMFFFEMMTKIVLLKFSLLPLWTTYYYLHFIGETVEAKQ